MIRVLSFLILALVSHARAQKCDDGTTYTLYSGDVNGKSTAEICKCVHSYLDANGLLKGKDFDCGETEDFKDVKWTYSDYSEDTGCTNCLRDCENVYADQYQLCKAIYNMTKPKAGIAQKSTSLTKPISAIARPIIVIVIIIITPYFVFVGIIIIW